MLQRKKNAPADVTQLAAICDRAYTDQRGKVFKPY
jgi:hypothetical protein